MHPELASFLDLLSRASTRQPWQLRARALREVREEALRPALCEAWEAEPERWETALRACLRDESTTVRRHAARLLGELGEPLALGLLEDLVHLASLPLTEKAGDFVAESAALSALGAFSSEKERLAPLLLSVLRGEGEYRKRGAEQKLAAETLLPLLERARLERQREFSREVVRLLSPPPERGRIRRHLPREFLETSFCYQTPEFCEAALYSTLADEEMAYAALLAMPRPERQRVILLWTRQYPETLERFLEVLEKSPEPALLEPSFLAELLASPEQGVRLEAIRLLERLTGLAGGEAPKEERPSARRR